MRDGWREVAVEDVAKVVGGGTPRSNVPEFWAGDIQWLTPKDLSDRPARYTFEGRRSITEAGLKASGAKVLPKGAVLLTSRAPVGYVSVASGPIATNQGFKSLILDDTQLPEYWYYLLGHSTAYLQANSGGSTFQEISGGALKKLRFLVPSLAEQERIVDLIAALDITIQAAKTNQKDARKALAELRRRTFSDLMETYGTVRADAVFGMLLGRQKSARQSVGHHVIPYIRAANISDAGFRLGDVQTMNFSPKEQERYCIRAGDVLLVEGGSLGQSAIWAGDVPGPVGFDKHVIRLRPLSGASSTEFAFHWTKWAYETGQFDAQATGATIRALGFGRASAMQVPNVPAEEQLELLQSLEAFEATWSQTAELLERMTALRSNLLMALLSGAHQIPDSYDSLIEEAA